MSTSSVSRCFFDSSSVAPIASGSIDSYGMTTRVVSLIGPPDHRRTHDEDEVDFSPIPALPWRRGRPARARPRRFRGTAGTPSPSWASEGAAERGSRRSRRRIDGAQVVSTDEFWDGEGFELSRLRAEVFEPLLAGRDARVHLVGLGRPGGPEASTAWRSHAGSSSSRASAHSIECSGTTTTCACGSRRRTRRGSRAASPATARRPARPGSSSGCRARIATSSRDDPIACADLVVDGGSTAGRPAGVRRTREDARTSLPGGAPMRVSPSTVIAGAALFFALGGSAIAVTDAVRPQAALPARRRTRLHRRERRSGRRASRTSATHSRARGSAVGARFNCAGAAPQARRVNVGVYEVRFAGNAAQIAVASAGGAETTVVAVGGRRLPDRPLGARTTGRDRHARSRDHRVGQPLQTRAFG